MKYFIAFILLTNCLLTSCYAVVNSPTVTIQPANIIKCPNGSNAIKKCISDVIIKTPWLDFDNGNGLNWVGWTYDADASQFDDPGWLWTNTNGKWGTCVNHGSYCKPMSFGKTSIATASIDPTQRAPSTATGGSLVVTELSDPNEQADWWLWQGGKTFGQYGIADSNTDRLSFYMKVDGMDPTTPTSPVNQNFHVGTYLCWDGDCPGESSNQHYYHWLALGVPNDMWLHVQIDQHPQHQRGNSGSDPFETNNPEAINGHDYFDSMVQIYLAMEGSPQAGGSSFVVDEFEFWNQPQDENEDSIASLWVGYSPSNDWWEIGFMDRDFPDETSFTLSTFEIRWSTEPITNENWSSATPINALYMGDAEHTSLHASSGVIRKAAPNRPTVWTRFTLDNAVETANNKLYFAVKDISVNGSQAGSGFPWNTPDLRDASSPYIKTIDYSLRAN